MTDADEQRRLKEVMISVARRWPDLSGGAFVEQVRSEIRHIHENDIRSEMWAMFSMGELVFTSERNVRLP